MSAPSAVGTYTLQDGKTGSYLTQSGSSIILGSTAKSRAAQFRILSLGHDTYALRSAKSGDCLDLESPASSTSADVVLRKCKPSEVTQQMILAPSFNGSGYTFRLLKGLNNTCLNSDQRVTQVRCNGSSNQQYNLMPINGSPSEPIKPDEANPPTPDPTIDSQTLPEPADSVADPRLGTWLKGDFNGLPFRYLLPSGYDPLHYKYPVVLMLHGIGERGTDNVAQLKNGIGDVAYSFELRSAVTAILVAPQCPKEDRWGGSSYGGETVTERKALALAQDVVSKMGGDRKRIYVSGISMGGIATWDMIWRYNDVFAAGMPLSGDVDFTHGPALLKTPIWSFHGSLDTIVTPLGDERMYAYMQANGGIEKYTEIIGAGHAIPWESIYDNVTYWQWLMAQRKQISTP